MLCHGTCARDMDGFVVCTEQHSRSCLIFLPGLLFVQSDTRRVQRADLIDILSGSLPPPG
jgi:hypothetical protein